MEPTGKKHFGKLEQGGNRRCTAAARRCNLYINQKANQVRQLNEKLKEAYDELDTFSFTISHDLKTPITSIRNYTELILEEGLNLDIDIVNMLSRILKSTDKMQLLIKEVLSYSRISRRQLKYEEIDMHQLVQEVSNEIKAAYKNSKVDIRLKTY